MLDLSRQGVYNLVASTHVTSYEHCAENGAPPCFDVFRMRLKHFIKHFSIALVFQIALQVIVSPLLSRLSDGNMLPDFLDFYVYHPFISGVIKAGGYEGESTMIWPPVYGTAVGILVYSVVFGLLISYLTARNWKH